MPLEASVVDAFTVMPVAAAVPASTVNDEAFKLIVPELPIVIVLFVLERTFMLPVVVTVAVPPTPGPLRSRLLAAPGFICKLRPLEMLCELLLANAIVEPVKFTAVVAELPSSKVCVPLKLSTPVPEEPACTVITLAAFAALKL